MPEPISSHGSGPVASSYDLTVDEAGAICRADGGDVVAPSHTESPAPLGAGAQLLVSQHRTSGQASIAPYADAGITSSNDAAYVGAAALKGRDPSNGIEVEVFSGSVQVGGENEAQAGLARLGLSGRSGSVTAEFLTARAHGGAHNDDGSIGFNAGARATGAGIEGTLVLGESSITGGVAVSLGADVQVGVRDLDNDGNVEVCAKVSVGFLTAGFCAEN